MRYSTYCPLEARDPVRYCLTKVLRIVTRSLYSMIKGLRSTSRQNLARFVQCPSAEMDQLSESTLVMSCAVAQNILQKKTHLEGSIASMAAPVDMNIPYGRAKRHPLDLVSETSGQKCCCIPLSKSCGGVNDSGTIGEWTGGIGGGLVMMFM